VRTDVRPLRPEHPTAADDEQRRQQRDHREQTNEHADSRHRSETGGGVHLRGEQTQHAEHDGAGACDDCRPGAVQRERHRLVPVLMPAQLLAITSHEEQGIVGARAEHQHCENARALRVDRQTRVRGKQVDQSLSSRERDTGGDHGK
jgi:hypothetical protein